MSLSYFDSYIRKLNTFLSSLDQRQKVEEGSWSFFFFILLGAGRRESCTAGKEKFFFKLRLCTVCAYLPARHAVKVEELFFYELQEEAANDICQQIALDVVKTAWSLFHQTHVRSFPISSMAERRITCFDCLHFQNNIFERSDVALSSDRVIAH